MDDVDSSESDESDVSLSLATRSTGRIATRTFNKSIHCKQMHRKKRMRNLLISRITYKEWGLGVRESAIAFRNFENYLYLIIWG